MRGILVISSIFAAMAILPGVRPLASAAPPGREIAVVEIQDQTKLLKATLKREVHFRA